MARILAHSSPSAGHVLPMIPGLQALQARGHDVHLRTDAAMLDLVAGAGVPGSPVDPRVAAIPIDDGSGKTGRARMHDELGRMLARAPYDADDLRAQIDSFQPDVLIVDTLSHGAGTAAEASGLPWAISFPTLPPLREPGIPPFGLGLAPLGGPLGRLRDAVLWPVVEKGFSAAMLPLLNPVREAAGLAPVASPLEPLLHADRLLVLTGEPLDYPRHELPANVVLCGAQSWDPPAAAPDWLLEPGDPWVLVSCSTEYQGDEALAQTAVAALRELPVRVLITAADATDGVGDLTAPNVRLERFVPHAAVLPHLAAVVCHGGMGTVQKAVGHGVPLVVVPFGRDQPEVARRVEQAQAGVRLPARRLTAPRLRAAVQAALGMRPQARAAAQRLAAAGGPERFADAVEGLLAERPAAAAPAAVAA